MSVEAKIVCSQTRETIRQYTPLNPGDGTFVNPFDDAIVSVSCDKDDFCGQAIIDPQKRKFIGAAIFRHPEELAQEMDIDEPIYFANNEILVIYSSGCTEEIYLTHIPGSDVVRTKILQLEAVEPKKPTPRFPVKAA